MSSNRGLRMNTNNIIVSQNGQLKYNNDDGVSEYTITNIQPSELSKESSQSSKISNLNIPVQFKGPRLSNIYYGTNKISKTGQINDVSNFYESNNDADIGLDTSFGSIQFDGIGRAGGSGGEEGKNKGFSRSKGSISFNSKNNSRKDRPSGEEDGGRSNKSIRFVEQNDGGVGGYAGEEIEGSGSGGFIGFDGKNERWASGSGGEERGNIEFSGTQGSIRFGSRGNGRASGSGGEEGKNKGFSRSKGSISFNSKNNSRKGRPSGEEDGGRSNKSIQFVEQNDGGVGGYAGEEIEGSGSGGFIGFDGKNERWASGSGGEERGNIEFSGTQGSIRFGSKGNGRAGGYSGEKSGGSRSEGFIGFGRKNEGGASRSGEEEKRNKGFSGSNGSIRFDGKNEGGIGGFGEKNIKISGGHRANRSSRSRNIGRRGNFKLSIGSIQLGKENGEISRSNSILAKITGKNYGSRRFGNGNKFVGDSGMSEVGGSKSFGEKMNKFSKTGGIYEDRILDDYNENNRSDGTGEVRFGEYSSLENSGN